ncbi:MAG: J domain-containing protein [Colwellia sp.]|jgi:DnaJ-class molecular chaperone with C-terminal Zn finger domain
MNIDDAAKILSLDGEINPTIVKKAYRQACSKFHPDKNPAGEEMMKLVNEAYETLKSHTGNVENGSDNYDESLFEALNAIINLTGLDIEICGAWVWVSGNTIEHKEEIKAAGFKWAKVKKMWFFRPANYKSLGRGKWDMKKIRGQHGTQSVRNKRPKKLKDEAISL